MISSNLVDNDNEMKQRAIMRSALMRPEARKTLISIPESMKNADLDTRIPESRTRKQRAIMRSGPPAARQEEEVVSTAGLKGVDADKSDPRNPKPAIRNPSSKTRNPKPETRNSKFEIRNPKPEIRVLKPEA